MVRGLVMATAALLMAVTSADAGLFFRSSGSCGGCAAPAPVVVSGCGSSSCDSCCSTRKIKVRKSKRRDCCAPVAPSCCAPAAPVCAAPAPSCCAPAPTCCAPAPSCCAPVAPACGACGTMTAPATAAPVPPMTDGGLGEAPKPKAVDTPAPPQ